VIGLLDRLARPLLHALDPEDAHGLAIKMLKFAPLPPPLRDDKRLGLRVFGLNFPNPVGIAAGFDKNAEVPDALLRVGFGFVEVGTITPLPQPGNPRPRLFRLDADHGVINRLGFNSQGADAALRRLAARAAPSLASPASGGGRVGGIVGINVGANKDSADRVADYVQLIERFAAVASYVTVNISSPNTPGLRNLQQASVLDDLLARVIDARERVAPNAGPTPVLLKIAPDLSLGDLDDVVGIARARRVDGMIVGNTTVARPPNLLETETAKEAGGLSGRPLYPLANRMLAETYVRVEDVFPLIGAGGIDSGATALAKIRAGASLVQVYSGLVFRGLGLIAEIKNALLAALEDDGQDTSKEQATLKEFIGADAAAVTAEPWPR
jgi:dihydroorotate dehydrogenase